MNKENFRLVTIHGIEEFSEYKNKVFKELMISDIESGSLPEIYIGRSFSHTAGESKHPPTLVSRPSPQIVSTQNRTPTL